MALAERTEFVSYRADALMDLAVAAALDLFVGPRAECSPALPRTHSKTVAVV